MIKKRKKKNIKQGKKDTGRAYQESANNDPHLRDGISDSRLVQTAAIIPGLGSAPRRGRGELGLEASCSSFSLYG
jgi:hypothetical protein